jgi:hypothetical protein
MYPTHATVPAFRADEGTLNGTFSRKILLATSAKVYSHKQTVADF